MKKSLLFGCFYLLFCSLFWGQSILLKNQPGTTTFDPHGFGEEVTVKVINTADTAQVVMVERITNSLGSGQESYFCWDVCYGPTTDRSVGGIRLTPGDSTTAFLLHFSPNGNSATGTIGIRFFVRGNPTDHTEYEFKFLDIATDLEDGFDPLVALGAPFPNPAKNQATIRYQLPFGTQEAHLRLYNLIGREIRRVQLDTHADEVTLLVNEIPAGLYFVYLRIDGKEVTSRKLIVAK